MRRAGGLLLLAALVAGCSTGSLDDLPTAAGRTTATAHAEARVVPGSELLDRAFPDVSRVPRLVVPDGSGRIERSLAAPVPGPTDPLEFFRERESGCSAEASLRSRGGTHPAVGVEHDRFSGAVVVRQTGRDRALILDGRGTRLIVEGWRTAGRVLPESGQVGDLLPEPYRSGCPGISAQAQIPAPPAPPHN